MIAAATTERPDSELAQQIVYAVSHDLRAPTRHIHAFVELLASHMEGQLDEVATGYLARLSDAADTFEDKLEALTRFSRVVTGAITPRCYSAAEAVSEAISRLGLQIADANAEITVDDLPVVLVDPEQLTTVFSELIENSLKFCPHGSSIRITSAQAGEDHMISVADSGPGFRGNNAATAFELFRRFHPSSVPGTGTGLAIVDRIVQRHGGRTAIESDESGGARIQIFLPIIGSEFGQAKESIQ